MRLILLGFCAEASNERSAHDRGKKRLQRPNPMRNRDQDELIECSDECSGIAEAHNL